MANGVEIGKENIRRFAGYWNSLRAAGAFLPLKADGTVWVDKIAKDAGVGKSSLRQNPQLRDLYQDAVRCTLESRRKIVEARLGPQAATHFPTVRTTSTEALDGVRKHADKCKELERRVSNLEQQLAVKEVAHQQAMEKVKRLERENEGLRFSIARCEFQVDNAINPGPY